MKLRQVGITSAESGGTLRIWRPTGLESLELRVGTSFLHAYPLHWHDDFFFSAITAGAGHFYYRGSDHLATRGTLVLVAPGEIHTHDDHDGGRSFRAMFISSAALAELASEVTQGGDPISGVPSSAFSNEGLFRTFLQLHQALDGCGNRLHRDSLLLSFLAELIPQASGERFPVPMPGRENLAVRRAREFLDQHYNREISLKELAAVANLSPHYFHVVFYCQI